MATLIDILARRAKDTPDRVAYVELANGLDPSASFRDGELAARAAAVAQALRDRGVKPGERALLVYDRALEFVAAFYGCLSAGVVAVPAYAPEPARLTRSLERLSHIIHDAQPVIALSETAFVQALTTQMAVLDTSVSLPEGRLEQTSPEALALLQYTSGSTEQPKGVQVSHDNLLANLEDISIAERVAAHGPSLSWLPFSHDMGLVEGLLHPLYAGRTAFSIPTRVFLARPIVWLEALSRHRVTSTGGPSFAYALCVKHAGTAKALDLSAWKLGYNGAEPVSVETLERFYRAFEGFGLTRETLRPVYGLAECTLLASGGRPGLPPRVAEVAGRRVAVIGPPCANARAFIDAPDAHGVGEICLQGRSVAKGYFRREQDAAFCDGVLRTGDLGCLIDGELVVSGRKKDLIIVRGRNLYPQDIEAFVERVDPRVRPGASAAFAVDAPDGEAVGIVCEITDDGDAQRLARTLAAEIARGFDAPVARVTLIAKGAALKTTSGKIQRQAAKHARFAALGEWSAPIKRDPRELAAAVLQGEEGPLEALDSLERVHLVAELETQSGKRVSLTALAQARTLQELAAALVDAQEAPASDISSAERGLVLAHALRPESLVHAVVWCADVSPGLTETTLRERVSALVAAHPKLRTVYSLGSGALDARVLEAWDPVGTETVAEAEWDRRVGAWAARPFALTKQPSFEVLALYDGGGMRLALRAHHAIADLHAFELLVHALFGEPLRDEPKRLRPADTRREDAAFFAEALAGAPLRVALPSDPSARLSEVGYSERRLSSELVAHMEARARAETRFELAFDLHVAWLRRLSGQQDLCIAVPMSTRLHAGEQQAVGSFIHLVPVRPGADAVAALRRSSAHRMLAYGDILEASGASSGGNGLLPFANVAFAQHELARDSALLGGTSVLMGHAITARTAPLFATEHDLAFTWTPIGEEVVLRAVCRGEIASQAVLSRWLEDWEGFALSRLRGVEPAERKVRGPALPPEGSVVAAFMARAAKTPEAAALHSSEGQTSFATLDRQSNQVARELLARGARAGQVLSLLVDPSELFVVLVLGAWKAGLSVTSFQSDHPAPWLSLALAQAKPAWLIRHTQQPGAMTLDALDYEAMQQAIIERDDTPLPLPPKHPLWRVLAADTRSAFSLFEGGDAEVFAEAALFAQHAPFQAGDVALMRALPGSYRAYLQMIVPLLHGASIYVASGGDIQCPGWLASHLAEAHVSHVCASPSQLRGVMNALFDGERGFAHVRHFVLHGEAISPDLRAKLARMAPQARVSSLYGRAAEGRTLLWDGEPAPGVSLPLQAPLLGIPFGDDTLFSTADDRLWPREPVRGLVKLLGLRFDTARVEAELVRAGATSAHVAISTDARGERRLAAWYEGAMSPLALRKALRSRLPEACVPASFQQVSSLVLPLPAPPWIAAPSASREPPRGATEATLAALVKELLQVGQVGRNDDFFALGGDSLLVLHLCHMAAARKLSLTPQLVARARTVQAMARALDASHGN